mmetsp:Transcript_19498/g.54377  ORF Transcript_19498/g.54377 Transcript_19498/m.54377 type:complete len:214 (+) Transcript_19498:289-930(+)
MNHSFLSVWIAVASILSFFGRGQGAEIRVPSGLRIQDPTADDAPDELASHESIDGGHSPKKVETTLEKGFRCKEVFDPEKKGDCKECEGGVKKTVGIGVRAQEVAEDIAIEVEDMHTSMLPDHKSLLPSDDTMMELIALDDIDAIFTSDEGTKTVTFGGYFKLFWGCNVTFTKKGKKMSKDIACGGKSFQGMGKKQDANDKLPTNIDVGDYEF